MNSLAKWIWLDPKKYPQYQNSAYTFFCDKKDYCVAVFRKKVVLSEPTVADKTRVSADCKYVLRLNGETVARGPAAVGGDYGNTLPLGIRYYDTPALSFRAGENEIEALVSLQPFAESDYSDGRGGFYFDAALPLSDGNTIHICSDESWNAAIGTSFIKEYRTDLTVKSPPESKARAVDFLWNLQEKNIPELKSEYIVPTNSATFSVTPQSAFTVDFGKVYSGYLRIDGEAVEETEIVLEFFERENYPITFRDSGKEYVKVPKGKFMFEHLQLRSARYVKITVAKGRIAGHARWEYVTYPAENRGSFRCSDARLNAIYDVCVRTTRNCMQTYHLDSPVHQEAIGCTGDYVIQSLIGYYAFGDYKLTRLDLVRDARYFRLKNGHRLHTSYGMLWVQWLYDYILYSGDKTVYVEVEDALHILMRRYEGYLDNRGIIAKSHNFWFVDWSLPKEIKGAEQAKIVWQASLTAFAYNGFMLASELVRKFGDKTVAAHYGFVAQKIRRAFNETFWDEKRGLYFGGLEDDDSIGRKFFGVHENTLAVLYGLTDRNANGIMEKVMTDESLTGAQPYFMHFVLLALQKVGLFEKYGLSAILRWQKLLDECDSSLKEAWNDMPGCDYSHAWSGTPGFILPYVILGVRPTQDGFADFTFSPKLCGLDWAEGTIPTPQGDYYVKIDKHGKEIRKMQT